MSIKLTEAAATQIKVLLTEASLPEATAGLRLGVTGGGCAGYSYTFDLGKEPAHFDSVFEQFGARVFCDKKSYLFLNGTEIDYQKTTMSQGFVVKNPNSKGSCGCGSSFGV